MRRENRKKNKYSSNRTIYITGGVLIFAIAAFVITFIVYSNNLDDNLYSLDSEYLSQYTNNEDNNNLDETTSASSSIGKNVEDAENNLVANNNLSNNSNNKKVNNIATSSNSKVNTTKTNNKSQPQKTSTKDPVFKSPLEGTVSKEYAKENLIYSETLKEWTTHMGVDIKAEKATVVKSAADGTVKYIKNDPRYGLTIIIEHSNGFQTLYANLLTTEFVSEGEKVKAGQTIGTVGDSAIYEIVDEPHLHFEILKNNKNLNPSDYIKF